ncbi:hypothetical protein OG2516_16636 [Oceanicola granulosus HTCC2516]|uniref:Uncharacterized protein n=1 Tax=Oceanicola granulosus (strain ATCC BAA-861 / DSM 15982 / KCTC 12143 / HTCC2516) TaxID=314256 RepID=Q2CCF6_OCEGH|nr:hypothetical protein [Oceanicola granulosus]EAR50362.1 hypothetical protein OG2516_16636 [Oceanicola granulosus HTCC2516]
MADFLRPEAVAALARWREVMIAAALFAAGLWLGLTSFGILGWIGWLLAAGGVALGYAALQRLRFARGGGGVGIVTIDERRVVYYGPLTGGVADLDALLRLELDPQAHPAHWILTSEDGEQLAIPVDAEGADGLFDLFAALPGLSPGTLVSRVETPPTGRTILWQRSATAPAIAKQARTPTVD